MTPSARGPDDDVRRERRGRAFARDRDVLLIAAIVVGGVLGLNLLTAAVPGLDALLARLPVIVILMVAVTTLVLVRAVGRRGPR